MKIRHEAPRAEEGALDGERADVVGNLGLRVEGDDARILPAADGAHVRQHAEDEVRGPGRDGRVREGFAARELLFFGAGPEARRREAEDGVGAADGGGEGGRGGHVGGGDGDAAVRKGLGGWGRGVARDGADGVFVREDGVGEDVRDDGAALLAGGAEDDEEFGHCGGGGGGGGGWGGL